MEENNATSGTGHADKRTFERTGAEQMNQLKHKGNGNSKLAAYSEMSPDNEKIDLNLLHAEKVARDKEVSFIDVAAGMGIRTNNKGVMLEIITHQINTGIKERFLKTGVEIRYVSEKYNRVSVVISNPDQLHLLARIPEVRRVRPEYGGRTHGGTERTVKVKSKLHNKVQ